MPKPAVGATLQIGGAPYAAKALDEPAQVFVIHVDGEFAKALPKTSAEAAAVGPTC